MVLVFGQRMCFGSKRAFLFPWPVLRFHILPRISSANSEIHVDRGLEPDCAWKGRRCLKTGTFRAYFRGSEHIHKCEHCRYASYRSGSLLHAERCKFMRRGFSNAGL